MEYTNYFIDLITKANNNHKESIRILHNEYDLENDQKIEYANQFMDFIKDNKNKPYSLYQYGNMLISGCGVEKDINKGIELLKESKRLGCSQAYYILAYTPMQKKIMKNCMIIF